MPPGRLTGVGRLEERERPGDFSGSSMQDQVALGAKRSPTPVKGGIAREAFRLPGWIPSAEEQSVLTRSRLGA